jgi:histidine triad (HIT) family protein
MEKCPFCAIAAGELPASIVYEDETVIAFDDIHPQAPVHTLIIPRAHYVNLNDDIPAEVLAGLLGAVQHVARMKGVGATGYRVIVNNGPDANQTVPHLHIHVMGGRFMAHGMVVFAEK